MDFKTLLDAFGNVASAIKTAAELPGVNLIPYASTVAGAISTIQAAVNLGVDVSQNIIALKNTFSDGLPSEEDLAALNADITALRARIHAALPDPEEGEPE